MSQSWPWGAVIQFIVYLQDPPFDPACNSMDHRSLVPRQYLGTPLPLQPPEYMAENHAPHLRAIEGYLFTLSMSVILMRLYIRIFILKKFGWDGKCRTIFETCKSKVLTASIRRLDDGRIRSMSQQHRAQCVTVYQTHAYTLAARSCA